MSDKVFWIVILILFLIVGVLGGILITTNTFTSLDERMWYYACNDGCSIATKDINGFLTNETWDCWDKCYDYINEINYSFDGETKGAGK